MFSNKAKKCGRISQLFWRFATSRFQINWEIMGQIYVALLANLNITEKVDRNFKSFGNRFFSNLLLNIKSALALKLNCKVENI